MVGKLYNLRMMNKLYGGTQSMQWWKIGHEWLAKQNFCR
jgi:hypothetical protein